MGMRRMRREKMMRRRSREKMMMRRSTDCPK
jgi:hypothetical protein